MRYLLLPALLLLASCGPGANNAEPEARPFVSLLAKFDGGTLLEGIELPDATEYWTQAEGRNGNAFPVKAAADAPDTLAVRLLADGTMQVRGEGAYKTLDVAALRARLKPLVDANLAEGALASSCGVLLVAHVDAPQDALAVVCFTCTNMGVGNLWLATRDTRDGNCRLMNLVVNPERREDPWYGYSREIPPDGSAARLEWKQGLPALALARGKRLEAKETRQWGKALSVAVAGANPRPRRLELPLTRGKTLRDMQAELHELAEGAFAEIEPTWPLVEPETLLDAGLFWRGSRLPRTDIAAPGPSDLFVRIAKGGAAALRNGTRWENAAMDGIRARVKDLADATRGTGPDATCSVNIVAEADADWRSLLQLCELCVQCRVPALRLCTRERGPHARLLPLRVDTTQAGREKYVLPEDAATAVVELNWQGELPQFMFGDGAEYRAADAKGWSNALRQAVERRNPRPHRLMLNLKPEQSMRRLEEVLAKPAISLFTEIEPIWAILGKPQAQPRALTKFDDKAGLSTRVETPELASFWKAAARAAAMTSPVVVDDKRAVLYLCASAEGKWSSRNADGKWTNHADDDALRGLLESAAALQGSDAVSTLQVVLAIDRRAPWKCAAGLAEMMVSARVVTLYVLTRDDTGLCLLDLSLPRGEGMPAGTTARAAARGKGADGKPAGFLQVGDAAGEFFSGDSWLEEMQSHAQKAGAKAAELTVIQAVEEPAQTFFKVLDALAVLEPAAICIGMPPTEPLKLPPEPEAPPGD